MENLTYIPEYSGQGKGFQDWTFITGTGLKEHLAFYYGDESVVGFITWDDFSEFASSLSTDVEDWGGLDDAPPLTEIIIGSTTYIKIR